MPCFIGATAHFAQQLFPLGARQSVIVPIGARVFAAMVKKPVVIVLHLQRCNFVVDELIQNRQISADIIRNLVIH